MLASLPLKHIAPPLVWEVPELTPLLLTEVILYIVPPLPLQLAKPPSSPAVLSLKVELASTQSAPMIFKAPPSLVALLSVNWEFVMVVVPSAHITPPYAPWLLVKMQLSTVNITSPEE